MWRKTLARGSVDELAFTSDGRSLVMLWDTFLFAWDLTTRTARKLAEGIEQYGVTSPGFIPSPAGGHVLTTNTREITIYSLTAEEPSSQALRSTSAAFVDGGKSLLTLDPWTNPEQATFQSRLTHRNWETAQHYLPPQELRDANVLDLVHDPVGGIALVAVQNDPQPRPRLATVSVNHRGRLSVRWLDWTADVRYWNHLSESANAVITRGLDLLPVVRDLTDGSERFPLRVDRSEKICMGFHPYGHLLAVGSTDGTVRFLDAKTGELRQTFDWKVGRVRCVAFSPNGLLCAAGGDQRAFIVWDVED